MPQQRFSVFPVGQFQRRGRSKATTWEIHEGSATLSGA